MKGEIAWLAVHAAVILVSVSSKGQFAGTYSAQAGMLMIGIGAVIWALSARALGGFRLGVAPGERLATAGVYARLRHPMFIAVDLVFAGIALYLGSLFGLVLIIAVLVPVQIYRGRVEERELSKKFGAKYAEYKGKTLF